MKEATDPVTLRDRATAMASDTEVVTHALVRKVRLPGPGGPATGAMALITLDNGRDHTRPNTFGVSSLLALDAAIDDALTDPEIAAIGITGKPFVFAAGADLGTLGAHGPEGIRVIAELGHDIYRKLGEGGKPSFAFVNGVALGGGLELALHCDYRTTLDSARGLGLPEVMLGLIPGWGGAWILPHLIGPDRAVTVIVENPLSGGRSLNGREAYEIGLSDACFGGADFLEQSLAWAGGVLGGDIEVSRPEPDRGPAWDAALARADGIVRAKTGGASPAARRAVELLAAARDTTRAVGFAAEDQALQDLARTSELPASLYAFDLVQKRARRPAGAPDPTLARPVAKVGIVGAGLMASQLAVLFARRLRVPVILTDLDTERVSRGIGYVHAELDSLRAKGRMTADAVARAKASVTGSVDPSTAFADADFVIEAVFEEMSVKKRVLAEIEPHLSPDCVLATNTSSLSITEMAAGLGRPERLVGFHFFNPVAVMPLLEIGRGDRTDLPTLATAFALAKALRKTAVLVRDSPSFIVNRLLGRFLGEVLTIVDEGTPAGVAERAFAGVAPMPPLALLGLVGPAIGLHNGESLAKAFPDRFSVSPTLRRVVAAGKPGFYLPDGTLDPEVVAMIEPPATESGQASAAARSGDDVRVRVLTALADEVSRMLDDGIVAAPEDIDLAMITGAGFSFWNGGLTMLLDRTGAAERATGRRFHQP
ncbi:MAG: 3-hydroxyacyl-CoA dehydrogenase NAD-binding domain-containing protein [Nocardioides sp.]